MYRYTTLKHPPRLGRREAHLRDAGDLAVHDAELFGVARGHVGVAVERRVHLDGAAPAVPLDDVAQRLPSVLRFVRLALVCRPGVVFVSCKVNVLIHASFA